jgi:hypothetical protein
MLHDVLVLLNSIKCHLSAVSDVSLQQTFSACQEAMNLIKKSLMSRLQQ